MDYATKVRRTAAEYVERYGDGAVEIIRKLCIRAHRDGDVDALRIARDVGVAADEMLMARAELR